MQSLFDRLGKERVLFQVVGEFYKLIQEDDRINGFFKDIDMASLRQHQLEFLSALLGGPEQYSGRSLKAAHKYLQLKQHHFDAVAENLVEALRRFDVGDDDIREAIDKVAVYKGEIVTE